MRALFLLWACAGVLAAPAALAHEDHPPKPKPQEKGKSGKPDPQPGRTALAESESNQRFCMKNKDGRVHCIPFGPH